MSRWLGKQDIVHMLYGAAFLSTSGGGPLHAGLAMLTHLEKSRKIKLELVDPSQMQEGEYVASLCGFGRPDSFDDGTFGQEVVNAFIAFRDLQRLQGKEVRYVCSLEYAGFNTFTPVLAAIKLGVPMLDIDLNGKAIPELNASLGKYYEEKMYPLVISNGNNDVVTIQSQDTPFAEKLMLEVAKLSDMKTGICNAALSKSDVLQYTVVNGISHCMEVGKILLKHKGNTTAYVQELGEIMELRELCCGQVTRIDMLEQGKFNSGTIAIHDNGKKISVGFKNETMIIRDEERVLLTVPDRICLLETETFQPITCSEIQVGMHLQAVAMKAPPPWKRNTFEFEFYKPYLEVLGSTGGPVLYSFPS